MSDQPMSDIGSMERNRHAAEILDAWGTAIRGDWGSIDGRTCRTELSEISAYLCAERPTLTLEDVGVCEDGDYGAHWIGTGYGHDC